MLANPAISAGLGGVVGLASGRTLVSVVKGVGAHNSLEAVVVSHAEGRGNLVLVVLMVGKHSAGATMASLVVVIVDES